MLTRPGCLSIKSPLMAPSERIFVSPVLKGARFETNAVPVEVLPELASYRDIVIELARWIYKSDHPGRRRVPKGFDQRFSLRLREVLPGSAVPQLLREPASDAGLLFFESDEFDRARDTFNTCIEQIRDGNKMPEAFTPRVVSLVSRLGLRLLSSESIEFSPPDGTPAPRFDHGVRQRIAELANSTYLDEVTIAGFVEAVDKKEGKEHFRLHSEEYGDIELPLSVIDEKAVFAALQHSSAARVTVPAIALLSADGKIQSVIETGSPEIDDDIADVRDRVEELRKLDDGWFDGRGKSLDRSAVEWLEQLSSVFEAGHVPRPYLYPTEAGGARAEWTTRGWEVSIEYSPSDKTNYVHALHIETDKELEEDITLDRVAAFLHTLTG
jgi:hypothetical protein